MSEALAIVGLACRYPDANSPAELWETVLAQRRAFRRMPAARLRLEDYASDDPGDPDRTYLTEAAVLEGYAFDRVRYRVAGSTFRSADLTHWLALDVAAQALRDAGFPDGEGLPRETTGVVLGNTLTGEFSRANALRLRWPYVRRVVEDTLARSGMAGEQLAPLLADLEERYKAPFPPAGEETLAGGLSNTIAGRVCNHFDLKGGGYVVDGACASSLLALTTTCSALAAGDLDVALAGGVDLSLDPFELVGFARTGALAPEEMRVYDARSAGFWPGEGCGFAVLMRHSDALARGLRIRALIRGWGISSDGQGGITRPEVEGQLLAIRRAYRRAGFGIGTVEYFEGHGTGTAVGDATELQALTTALREAEPRHTAPALGTVKANIGHTKAAAGIAGLIKAVLALEAQTLPPTTGASRPHPLLSGEAPALRVPSEAECWPPDRPLRAAVSAMGFGGINTHVVLEGACAERRRVLAHRERRLSASAQDGELFLLAATDPGELRRELGALRERAAGVSRAELTDLAFELQRRLSQGAVRAAAVAATPAELAERLGILSRWLEEGVAARLNLDAGLFLGAGAAAPRLGFLFPGQGSPAHLDGGVWRRRFAAVRELYAAAALPFAGEALSTEVAQPAIATAALAGLRVLADVGITAALALGHSLGEVVALHWAGALDEAGLLRLTRARGQAMARLGAPSGAMASLGAGAAEVEPLLVGLPVVIAGYNSPRQTVVSGEASAVERVVTRARERRLSAVRLEVSHAFHSPLVARAEGPLAELLARERLEPLTRPVLSTVKGGPLAPGEDLRALLRRQLTGPVRFTEALAAAGQVDLWLEVGPGRVLSGLVAEATASPVLSLDAGGASLRGLLRAIGAAFALGAPLEPAALFDGRFARPFDLRHRPTFLESPCEQAPLPRAANSAPPPRRLLPAEVDAAPPLPENGTEPAARPLDIVRALVAARAELPVDAIGDDDRLLGDLHLNSISVGQVVVEAARRLGLPPPAAPLDYAQARVASLAQALEELARAGVGASPAPTLPAGVDAWVRPFRIDWVERPRPRAPTRGPGGDWRIFAPEGHPLAASLRTRLEAAGIGPGIAVCLPPDLRGSHAGLLLEAARAALAGGGPTRFLAIQQGGGASAFARTLQLEAPHVATCIVDLAFPTPEALDWLVAEAAACSAGLVECRYSPTGVRQVPVLRPLPPGTPSPLPLGPEDVLLVTGGGKGIAAECALELARTTGARLALLGRSRPETDPELSANLARMAAAGVRALYIPADVTDEAAVQRAIREVEAGLGPVTALLHGAGANVPCLLEQLEERALLGTLAPKYEGARNVLAALAPERLRLFIAFGSIIGRVGMAGEADYALANEWLTRLTERLQKTQPRCRCLSIEWSIWSGVGMGERLGRVDALARQGIAAIPPDQGLALLRELLTHPEAPVAVVVSGRLGERPPLEPERPELPFLRFLERPRVHYPGIELVVEAELSGDSDPSLDDHVFRGERLLPAVLGLEAMAQAVLAVTGTDVPPAFERVAFERPVVVPPGTRRTVRIAALVRAPGVVDVVLRCDETSFQVDHFRATCRLRDPAAPVRAPSLLTLADEAASHAALDPRKELYGGLLFHDGRFRRVARYLRLQATECVVELTPPTGEPWFGRYLPDRLVLGDPAARDAAIHALQACIPHARVLPVGIEAVLPADASRGAPRFVSARERFRDERSFVYDVELASAEGVLLERWEGLRLQRLEATPAPEAWPPSLLAPYAERRLGELVPGSALRLALERASGPDRRVRSDRALKRLLGEVDLPRRPDGKPVPEGSGASAAHAEDLTLAVVGPGAVGCDLQAVETRPASVWRELLGPERAALAEWVAREHGEELSTAATRVWAALECLKKAGLPGETPLVFGAAAPGGWLLFTAGSRTVATLRASVQGAVAPLVLAALS